MGEGSGPQEQVYMHFGSAPFFGVFDTESRLWTVVANTHQSHPHGHCKPAEALEITGAEVVITGGIGAGAVANLKVKGIKVYQAPRSGTLAQTALLFEEGKLKEIASGACEEHDAHHGPGNSGLRHEHQ